MKFLNSLICAAVLLIVMEGQAHAYMDAGSGSMILQLLLGGLAGVALAVKIFWHRLLEIFHIRKKDPSGPIQ